MFKIVLLVVLSVLCVVNTQSDYGCGHSRSYTRVKRGKYPGPPIRFYSRPPVPFHIKGPYSYTPPPFMVDDEPIYPGSRPYKVSKRPTNEGLPDEDINNLVKNLSKQDLDKILEFAEREKYSENNKVGDNNRPFKRENSYRPSYAKEMYKGNSDDEKFFEEEFMKHINYVTAATPIEIHQDNRRPTFPIETDTNKFKVYRVQNEISNQYKVYNVPSEQRFLVPPTNNNIISLEGQNSYPGPTTSPVIESNDEDTLPPPINLREEEYDASYTNNVPTVIKADSSSYQLENFGDLPLMNYNSKLHSVSSYHVPHYTVTQSKSESLSPATFASSQSSSSTLLKPSPAAAAIQVPVEPAPPKSAAKLQSDAHLKAIKIWSHRSKGVAYTLHDDGTLTPERSRPKYG